MTELEKLVVRCWSAVVARGLEGTAIDVVAELTTRGSLATVLDVARRMAELRVRGQLPSDRAVAS